MKRRDFLTGAGLLAVAPSIVIPRAAAQSLGPDIGFPFSVASGDPSADGMILWTRLARASDDFTPVSRQPIYVEWMVATDDKLSRIVRRGMALAMPEFGHSVHVDVRGLQPDRDYWYAFRLRGLISPIGRTRTLPGAGDALARCRFNVVSCQNWEQGYFDAYDGMADDDAAFVLHLGDYIYDVSRGGGVRSHEANTLPTTLDQYRRRHALYKTDPALRRAHERMPFVLTLDNHDGLEQLPSNATEWRRRQAAYQAWYEFQPVRWRPNPGESSLPIKRSHDLGALIRLTIPDTRQFRQNENPCIEVSDPHFAYGVYEQACAAADDPHRSMLGQTQQAWLEQRLTNSPARWNIIASTVKMTPFDMSHQHATYRYLQSWDGYPAERGRILDRLAEAKVANPISLSGDIHSYLISKVVRHVGDHPETALMTELVGTSISALWPDEMSKPMQQALPHNPHIQYFESRQRGYMRCTVTADEFIADLRTISDARRPGGTVATERSFIIENGRVGAQQTSS